MSGKRVLVVLVLGAAAAAAAAAAAVLVLAVSVLSVVVVAGGGGEVRVHPVQPGQATRRNATHPWSWGPESLAANASCQSPMPGIFPLGRPVCLSAKGITPSAAAGD